MTEKNKRETTKKMSSTPTRRKKLFPSRPEPSRKALKSFAEVGLLGIQFV